MICEEKKLYDFHAGILLRGFSECLPAEEHVRFSLSILKYAKLHACFKLKDVIY